MEENWQVNVGDTLTSETSKYTVKKFLGVGGFGRVALCEKEGSDQMVALKIINKLHGEGDIREARTLQILTEKDCGRHHILECLETFQYEGHYCHAFEKLDKDLFDFLFDSRGLKLEQIRPIVAQMARALQYLKSEGIVHCDIKPENIMLVDRLTQPLQIKLIDFGLARPVSEIQQGELMGTLNYAAPEVYLGSVLTEAIDMWSMGCTTATLFLDQFLFFGDKQHDLLRHIVQVVGQPPDHVLDSGIRTSRFFSRSQSSSDWTIKDTSGESQSEFTAQSLDALFDRFKGDSVPTSAEYKDLLHFVDLLKHMVDPDPATRYTPEEVLSHPFITMIDLKNVFPDHYEKCQTIMAQVFPCVSTDADQKDQKCSRKRKRDTDEEITQKRRRTDDGISEGSERGEDISKGKIEEKAIVLQDGKERQNNTGEKDHNPPEFPKSNSAAEAKVATQGQKVSRKRKREMEEVTPSKGLRLENPITGESCRAEAGISKEEDERK